MEISISGFQEPVGLMEQQAVDIPVMRTILGMEPCVLLILVNSRVVIFFLLMQSGIRFQSTLRLGMEEDGIQ
jgi:hypothetical protein